MAIANGKWQQGFWAIASAELWADNRLDTCASSIVLPEGRGRNERGTGYLADSGAVIAVIQGYAHVPRLAVLVPARNVIELLKSNNVACEKLPTGKSE